jgi:hypothetical protein
LLPKLGIHRVNPRQFRQTYGSFQFQGRIVMQIGGDVPLLEICPCRIQFSPGFVKIKHGVLDFEPRDFVIQVYVRKLFFLVRHRGFVAGPKRTCNMLFTAMETSCPHVISN